MSANVSNKFSIKLCGKVFESNDVGFLDLNIIASALNLKSPSQWRNTDRRELERNAKLHFGKGGVNSGGYALADEDATIFYGMYISFDFGLQVVQAFRELRQGNLESALNIAASTMSEADAHYLLRQSKLKGMLWDEAASYAGIKHSRLCKKMLLAHPKFNYFDSNDLVGDSELAQKYFYNRGNKFTKNVKLCVTPEGREWLRGNRKWFNKAVELYKIETETPFS